MFQLDDTFSTPPASPGLMKFEEEQQRSPYKSARVRNERMFMNTSLSDLAKERKKKRRRKTIEAHMFSRILDVQLIKESEIKWKTDMLLF